MKVQSVREPERWSERAPGGSAEDAAGALMRRIRRQTDLSDAEVARWNVGGLVDSPPARTRVAWSVAIAAIALVAAAGVGTARMIGRSAARRAAAVATNPRAAEPERSKPRRRIASIPPAVEPPGEPEPAAQRVAPAKVRPVEPARSELARRPPPQLPTEAVEPSAPPPFGALERPPGGEPLSAPVLSTPAAKRSPSPAPPSASLSVSPSLMSEASLVERAFRRLRTDHDAQAALAVLEERERLYPTGALGTEAALARAEALVALGRDQEALPILLSIRDPLAGLTREVRAARADILVRAGRCPAATTDLNALVSSGEIDGPRERAVWGRATCRLAQGDRAAALEDLEGYLADFPGGRFAFEARKAVARLRRP